MEGTPFAWVTAGGAHAVAAFYFFSSAEGGAAPRLSVALSHCESVGCGTSTCLDKAEALTAGGPSIRFTICSLNASV